ncbi:MAG: Gfo/Idh/MocA family oxidoreductase, partial [Clostridia bacterium]|nr:Gfo/Idh/MocA family oxidoreductase [Clostridia bacterium]
MDTVRVGIIGIGNMGSGHFKSIMGGKVPGMTLTAVADIRPERLDWAAGEAPEVARFDDAIKMLDSGLIDAAIVATPHYFHPVYVTEALKRDIHVLSEKPAGVYTKAVREVNELAARSKATYAIMFNQRTNCVYRKMKEIVDSGSMGNIRRTNWIITDWYRSQSYYDSGAWRAT